MTLYTIYCDPNSPNTPGSGTEADPYRSMSIAENAGQSLSSTPGDIVRILCRRNGAAEDITALVVAGYTAGVVPEFIADVAYRHNGIPGSGYVLRTGSTCMLLQVPAVVDGLEITGFGSTTRYGIDLSSGGADGTIIKNNMIHTPASGAVNIGIRTPASASAHYVYNNIIHNVTGSTSGTGILVQGAGARVWNNLVYGCQTYGINSPVATTQIKNCALLGNGTDFTGSTSAASDYNVTSDATALGTNKATGKTAYADYFVDYANGDFHLKSSSATLWGINSADLSATFTDDIDGDARPSSDQFGIGADYYVVAGWSGKMFGVSPGAVNGVPAADISKIVGVD